MRVRYTPEAFADREKIFGYLREHSPSGARNVMASIREAVRLLRDQPYSGYKTDDPDIRSNSSSAIPTRCSIAFTTV